MWILKSSAQNVPSFRQCFADLHGGNSSEAEFEQQLSSLRQFLPDLRGGDCLETEVKYDLDDGMLSNYPLCRLVHLGSCCRLRVLSCEMESLPDRRRAVFLKTGLNHIVWMRFKHFTNYVFDLIVICVVVSI